MKKRCLSKKAEGGPAQPNMEDIIGQVASQLQQGADPSQIAAYFLQQNMQPEQIVQLLLQAGLPQDQAIQSVQQVMQQFQQAQGQDPNAQAQDPSMQDPTQQPMMAEGGPLKSELGYRAPLDGSTQTADRQKGVALLPGKYGDVNWFAKAYNDLRTNMENNYVENPYYTDANGNQVPVNFDPDNLSGQSEYVSMRQSAKRARELNALNRKNNLGFQKIQRDAFYNPNGTTEPIVASFAEGGAFSKEFNKALEEGMRYPDSDSENYGNDMTKLFTEAVRRNFAKSILLENPQTPGMFKNGGLVEYKGKMYPEAEAERLYREDMNKPVTSANSSPQAPAYNQSSINPVQFSGYQDPRTMYPSVNPFGRLLNQAFAPNQMRLIKVDNPGDYNLQNILNGTDPNFSLGNVETFRKGLFRRGVRYNLINKDTPTDQLSYGDNQSPMVEYKGEMYPEAIAERMYKNDMTADALGQAGFISKNNTSQMAPENNLATKAQLDFQNAINSLKSVGSFPRKAEDGMEMTYSTLNTADAADFLKNGVDKFNQVMSLASQNDPERRNAFYSAVNVQPTGMDAMSRGLYDQQGNFIPDSLNNQVLNPTMAMGDRSQAMFMRRGGNVSIDDFIYSQLMKASGGDITFTEAEMEILKKAGYKLNQ